jgi:ribonuclease HII
MRAVAPNYPHYEFQDNKGYPCWRHKMALQAYGPSTIHRRTWVFMDGLSWDMRTYREGQVDDELAGSAEMGRDE